MQSFSNSSLSLFKYFYNIEQTPKNENKIHSGFSSDDDYEKKDKFNKLRRSLNFKDEEKKQYKKLRRQSKFNRDFRIQVRDENLGIFKNKQVNFQFSNGLIL